MARWTHSTPTPNRRKVQTTFALSVQGDKVALLTTFGLSSFVRLFSRQALTDRYQRPLGVENGSDGREDCGEDCSEDVDLKLTLSETVEEDFMPAGSQSSDGGCKEHSLVIRVGSHYQYPARPLQRLIRDWYTQKECRGDQHEECKSQYWLQQWPCVVFLLLVVYQTPQLTTPPTPGPRPLNPHCIISLS